MTRLLPKSLLVPYETGDYEMNLGRRTLIKVGGAASASVLGGVKAVAASTDSSIVPLLAAGLDPMIVYRKMFASTEDGAECCWWYCGSLPFSVDEIGDIAQVQEETLRAHRTENKDANTVHLHWREAGVFRDIETGEIPKPYFNPVTGETEKRGTTLGGGLSQYIITRDGNGLTVQLDQAKTDVHSLTVSATINGDRVSLTHIENKSRSTATGISTLRSTLKIYASLDELKSSSPSVASKGFYCVRNMDTGKVFVAGLSQKATMDEKVNPIAWDRIKAWSAPLE
jgi:hypothetical protein